MSDQSIEVNELVNKEVDEKIISVAESEIENSKYEPLLDRDFPTWSHHGEVSAWLRQALTGRPPWDENDCASMIRAIGYFDKVDKYLTQALRTDVNGVINVESLKDINMLRDKLHKQLKVLNRLLSSREKRSSEELNMLLKAGKSEDLLDNVGKEYMKEIEDRKKFEDENRKRHYPDLDDKKEPEPESSNCAMGYEEHCEAHNVPLYNGECLVCTGQSGGNTLHKTAYVPKLTFTVDPFLNFICRQLISAHVDSGKNITKVYAALKEEYKINNREEAMIISTLHDMGYPVYKDFSGHTFLKNYYASLENALIKK